MKITYDPRYDIAYIRLQVRTAEVETIKVSDELNIDIAPDGTVYGIELLLTGPVRRTICLTMVERQLARRYRRTCAGGQLHHHEKAVDGRPVDTLPRCARRDLEIVGEETPGQGQVLHPGADDIDAAEAQAVEDIVDVGKHEVHIPDITGASTQGHANDIFLRQVDGLRKRVLGLHPLPGAKVPAEPDSIPYDARNDRERSGGSG